MITKNIRVFFSMCRSFSFQNLLIFFTPVVHVDFMIYLVGVETLGRVVFLLRNETSTFYFVVGYAGLSILW